MDAVGMERAALFGPSEGGSLAAYFAATHPERCVALVLYGAFARFSAWLPTPEALQHFIDYIDTRWGSGESLPFFAPSMVGNAAYEQWWRRFERLGASPADAMALMRVNSQIDLRGILPTIRVPTLVIHRSDDVCTNVEGGRELAAAIPGARWLELPGRDHLPWVGPNADEIVSSIETFLTNLSAQRTTHGVLATVMAVQVGDGTSEVDRSDALDNRSLELKVGTLLQQLHGWRVPSSGGYLLATFDGPSRAIAAALTIQGTLTTPAAAVRVCIHTGEVERLADGLRGAALDTVVGALRQAKPGEIVVSATVKHLAAGCGAAFEYAGADASDAAGVAHPLYRVEATSASTSSVS
jgi:hypothetical protein